MSNDGSVMNGSETSYAARVETLLRKIDEAPFPGAFIFAALAMGLTPAECVARGMELAP